MMFFSGGSSYQPQMTCGLKVDTRCRGWDRTMSKILKKIRGACYDLDAEEGMIYISGKVNPRKILSKIAKHGKHVELCWMRSGDQNYSMDERSAFAPYEVPVPMSMPMPAPPYSCGHLPYHSHRGYYPYHHYDPISLAPPHYVPHPYYY